MPLSKSANAGTAIIMAITQAIARVRKRLLSFFMMYSSILKETCIGFVSGRICSASARRCLSLRCGWRFFGTTSLYQKVFTFATFRIISRVPCSKRRVLPKNCEYASNQLRQQTQAESHAAVSKIHIVPYLRGQSPPAAFQIHRSGDGNSHAHDLVRYAAERDGVRWAGSR